MANSLQDLAAAALNRTPARPALEFAGQTINWGDMKATASGIERLLNGAGVRADAPIAMIPRNRPWAIAALLALLAHGRNIQMIYGFQSPLGIARDIDRLKPAALLAEAADISAEVREKLAADGVAAIAIVGMEASAVPPFERARAAAGRAGPASPQIEIFTSGTTGPPKQFAISYDVIARHHVAANPLPELDDEAARTATPMLLYFPVGNISGLYSTLPGLLKGHRAVLLDRFSIEAWRDFVVKHRPALSGIPPSFFQSLLEANIPMEDLSSIKAMGAGAAPLDPAIQQAFEEKYKIPVLLSYGATEFGGPVTSMTLEDHAKFGRAKIGTVGRPIPGAQLRAVNPENGVPCHAGEEGLLEVVSPRIGPDWIRTSDIGFIDEDGFLFLKGRADGAIMRGGFKVLPETIETALKLHPAVSDAVVVGVPDKRLGQVPAAALRIKPGAEKPALQGLEAHLRQHVMATHIPVHWIFCDDYPRTISAKIDRPAVRALFSE